MNECLNDVSRTMQLFREKGIRLLAVDFDKTLLSFHTGGAWSGKTSELVKGIRPFLAQLINLCLESDDIFVAVVTFSPQHELLSSVLESICKYSSDLYLQTCLSRSDFRRNLPGKEGHLVTVVKNIQKEHGVKIRPEEVFLLDDDVSNTAIALKFNHRAMLFEDKTTITSINHYLSQLAPTVSCTYYVKNSEQVFSQSYLNPQTPTTHSAMHHSSMHHSSHSLPSASFQSHLSLCPQPLFRNVSLPFSSHHRKNGSFK